MNRLRETGHFTAVSVTRPFEFEGQRKVDAADHMIAALEEAAHLVVVVEQVWNTVANTYELFEIQECCFLQRNACSRECCQIQ